jgi:hypothetical protein
MQVMTDPGVVLSRGMRCHPVSNQLLAPKNTETPAQHATIEPMRATRINQNASTNSINT